MGQQNSTDSENSSKRQNGSPLQSDTQNLHVNSYVYYPTEEKHCIDMLCGLGPNPANAHNQKWRRYIISQLQSLDVAVWPKLLIQVLKNSGDKKTDSVYQTELFYVDANYEKSINKANLKSFNILSKFESFMSDNEEIQEISQELNKEEYHPCSYQEVNQAVRGLLDISDIVDDNFIEPLTPQPWKSRASGQNLNMMFANKSKSFNDAKLEDFSLKSKEPIPIIKPKKDIPEWNKHRISTMKYTESYRTSLVSNPVPLVNGMDGRCINDVQDLYLAAKKYKTVTSLIQKHLSQEDHILHKMILQFEAYFIQRYSDVAKKFKQGKATAQETEETSYNATVDLQQLIIILYESISQFYCLRNLNIGRQMGQDTLFNRNNMINFTTSLVFRRKIYEIIFGLYSVLESEEEKIYQKKVEQLSQFQPEDFGVSEAFCLNQTTVNYLNGIKEINALEKNNDFVFQGTNETSLDDLDKEALQTKQKDKQFTDFKKQSSLLFKQVGSQPKLELEEKDDYVSYKKAIDALYLLKDKRSPVKKLKTIIRVAELINECIDDFYNKFKIKQEEQLSGDQTLVIFMYIIAKSKMEEIMTHCKIIKKFSTNNILNSISGYYTITLEASFNYISNLQLSKNFTSEEFRENLQVFKNSLEQDNNLIIPKQIEERGVSK